MSALSDPDEEGLDYLTLAELRGDDEEYEGPLDSPCPLCGPYCQAEYNKTRTVLRTWKPSPGFITYNCARCEAKGSAQLDALQMLQPRPTLRVVAKAVKSGKAVSLYDVERLWEKAESNHPTVRAYLRWRRIQVDKVPEVLRYHPLCPWMGKKLPCIIARYSDAVTGEPRGLWRRSEDGLEKPMTLGPMGGCVIRLWPDVGKRLVIGEGIETVLAAATRFSHRGLPLQPAWATGCANNMRRFPVLDGVEQLIILVDNDASGTGQEVAEECARRWTDAGREVVRLMPRKRGSDFNDLVMR